MATTPIQNAAGCVEGELTYTVNPDGSAKVKIDVVSALPPPPFGGGELEGCGAPAPLHAADNTVASIRATTVLM